MVLEVASKVQITMVADFMLDGITRVGACVRRKYHQTGSQGAGKSSFITTSSSTRTNSRFRENSHNPF
jgi:hypothetical protein